MELRINKLSNFKKPRVKSSKYKSKALIHALIAVASAMPISRIDPINNKESTILLMTLTKEI